MDEKTSEKYGELADYFALTVHQFVDRLHERAAGMEKFVGGDSQMALNDMAMAKIDREVNRIQEFFEENPERAALMAFGVGAIASRFLNVAGPVVKPEPAEAKVTSAKPKKAPVKKAPVKKAQIKKAPVKKAPVKKAA